VIDYTQGTFQFDYEASVDFDRLRAARVATTQAATRQSGLDALVPWKDENARYLTSLRAITLQYRSTTQYDVILVPQGKPVLFLSGGERLEDTRLVTDGEPEVLNRCGFDERLL